MLKGEIVIENEKKELCKKEEKREEKRSNTTLNVSSTQHSFSMYRTFLTPFLTKTYHRRILYDRNNQKIYYKNEISFR